MTEVRRIACMGQPFTTHLSLLCLRDLIELQGRSC